MSTEPQIQNGEILDEAPDGFDATLELAWIIKVPETDHVPVLHQKYQGAFRSIWVRVPTHPVY